MTRMAVGRIALVREALGRLDLPVLHRTELLTERATELTFVEPWGETADTFAPLDRLSVFMSKSLT